MKSLTIVNISSREINHLDWLMDSLFAQESDSEVEIIHVCPHAPSMANNLWIMASPKPSVWQGEHRLTNRAMWAASNARNTGIVLCKTEFIAFLDDRCVLLPGWLDAIKRAMEGDYAVAGSYQKRIHMTVENGVIKEPGQIIGEDSRYRVCQNERKPISGTVYKANPEWTYGCNLALPLEWVLEIGGFDETCDGFGMEDCIFGHMLANNGHPLMFDTSMRVVQDRTDCHVCSIPKGNDKGVSPNDKSHALLKMLRDRKTCMHSFSLRDLRNDVLAGKPWPIPTEPKTDWYDGQPLVEM